MNNLTNLEMQVMSKLLDGEKSVLAILREQLKHCVVANRELTGVGFFLKFQLKDYNGKLVTPKSFQFGDVHAETPSLKHGIGFLLYIDGGMLDMLEGYTYDEPWPEEMDTFEFSYLNGENRKRKAFEFFL